MWLLLRDSLAYEDGNRLVLLAGANPRWFAERREITIENLPTYFGPCSFRCTGSRAGVTVRVDGKANPPGGFEMRIADRQGMERKQILRRAETAEIPWLQNGPGLP